MIAFPNCKINLGLNISNKRSDGYHNLETCFYPLPLKDALEFIRSEELQFTTSGLEIKGNATDNICLKAYLLLKNDFPQLPALHIHLHKAIPMGAGLGGGSADGAFMLLMLNQHFNLQLPTEKLLEYALKLGSDCPFFILNKPCLGNSRGEVLQPVELNLSSYQFVVVNPGIHVSTAEAFGALTPEIPKKRVNEIIQQPIETWKTELVNDFEIPVFKQHPLLATIKQQLYSSGAVYASMSGSGSTVFGIFLKGAIKLPVFENVCSVFII